MAETKEVVAILFADVCGSTPLFESKGSVALDLIADCLDALVEIAVTEGGGVVRSKGDDVLCTFPDCASALRAAVRMITRQSDSAIDIHVGLHHGEVICARASIFGDAVNTAARLLALAKPREIIASEAVVFQLDDDERDRMRLLDDKTVKGRSESMNIYSYIGDEDDATFFVDSAGGASRSLQDDIELSRIPRVLVSLLFQGHPLVCRDGEPSVKIGRASKSNLTVDDPCVSREHASVTVRRGKVLVTDFSSTGTWVIPEGGEPVLLRREMFQIDGEGVLSLGYPPEALGPTQIRYSVVSDSGT